MGDLVRYEFVCDHDPCVCDDALRGVYSIEPHAGEDLQDFRGVIQIMLRDGGLIPIEPCEHGNYDKHVLAEFGWFGRSWCEGAGSEDNDE